MEGSPTGQGTSHVRAVVGQESRSVVSPTEISAQVTSAADEESCQRGKPMTLVSEGHAFAKGLRGHTDGKGEQPRTSPDKKRT